MKLSNGRADQNPHPWRTSGLCVGFVSLMFITTVFVGRSRPVNLRRIQPRSTGTLIDINHADVDTLCLLPRIGPRLARRVVHRRQLIGGFRHPDQLTQVPGIGEVVVSGIRPLAFCGQVERADPGVPGAAPQ